MRMLIGWIVVLMTLVLTPPIKIVNAQAKNDTPASKPEAAKVEEFKPEQQASKGSVTVGGNLINYDVFAGTLVVHTKDWDDVPQNKDKDDKSQTPEASMFYVAYFKSDNKGAPRPVTFLYNAARVLRPSGCTWGPLGRSASSPRMIPTRRPRPIRWSTTTTASST
jgi:carboxypeptidase C (cathepsin A)